MKRFLTVLAAAIPLFAASFGMGATVERLANTKHNFLNGPYAAVNAGPDNTMCEPCHTPHHAIAEADRANPVISTRLWNHQLSQASYTLYDGSTAIYTRHATDSQGMDRVSRLCLGCHDGSVALDAFGMSPSADGSAIDFTGEARGPAGANQGFLVGDPSKLGTDFRDDHPIGVEAIALQNDGLTPVTGSRLKTTTTVGRINGLRLAKMSTGYAVGCRTCHAPHGNGTDTVTWPHLLDATPNTLCNQCHIK